MRWIEYRNTIFCLDHVTHFEVKDDDFYIRVYFNFGYPGSKYEGMGSSQAEIHIPYSAGENPRQVILSIISGHYDLPDEEANE